MEHLNLPSRIFMYSICASIEYDLKAHILAYCEEKIDFSKEMIDKAYQRLNKNDEKNDENILNMLDLSDYINILITFIFNGNNIIKSSKYLKIK